MFFKAAINVAGSHSFLVWDNLSLFSPLLSSLLFISVPLSLPPFRWLWNNTKPWNLELLKTVGFQDAILLCNLGNFLYRSLALQLSIEDNNQCLAVSFLWRFKDVWGPVCKSQAYTDPWAYLKNKELSVRNSTDFCLPDSFCRNYIFSVQIYILQLLLQCITKSLTW